MSRIHPIVKCLCSFCQQDSTQVRLRLLQGREANICVECIVRLSTSTADNASCYIL